MSKKYIPLDIEHSHADGSVKPELRAKLRTMKIEDIKSRLYRYNPDKYPPIKRSFSEVEIISIMMEVIVLPQVSKLFYSTSVLFGRLK